MPRADGIICDPRAHSRSNDKKKEAGCRVMIVEVMKIAQQPAMAYDKVPHSTAAKSTKSGLLLNSSYVSATYCLVWLKHTDASFAERTCSDFSLSARVCGSCALERVVIKPRSAADTGRRE